jgi:hypothetical protein
MPHPEQRLEDIPPHRPQSFQRDARNLAMTANRSVSEYMRVKKKIYVDGYGARLLSPSPENQAR